MTSNDFKVSITWASAPSGCSFQQAKTIQSQQERLDLRPLAVWPDLQESAPAPAIPWTRATRAAAGLPSALAGEAS